MTYDRLEDVILDELFPDADLQLRAGRHVGREDDDTYSFLSEALDLLEPFYRRFGAELVHRSDGYFYLRPVGDRLPRSQLSTGEMLVGQALALLYLDPASLKAGFVTWDALVQRLSALVGQQQLVQTLNPRRRKFSDRVAEETVRKSVTAALRQLANLGFIDLLGDERYRLRPALMRFADPVRAASDPVEALERLVSTGDVTVEEEEEP